jgi:hypothetical protein
VESVVPLSASSLTAGSLSGRIAGAQVPTAAAPDTDRASELSLAGGAAAVAPCATSVGSAGGPQGVGAHPASAVGVVRDCSDLGLGAEGGGRARTLPEPRWPRDFPKPPLHTVSSSISGEHANLAPPVSPSTGARGSSGRVTRLSAAAPSPALAPGRSPMPSRLTSFHPRPCARPTPTRRGRIDLRVAASQPTDAARILERHSATATPGSRHREGGARSAAGNTDATRSVNANQQPAGMSAGRAAPTPSDEGGLWAATPSTRSLRSGSLRALRVTAARLGGRAPEARQCGGEREATGAIAGHVAHAPLSLGAANLAPRARRAAAAGIARRDNGEITFQYLRLSAALSVGTGRQVPALRKSHQLTVRRATPAQGGN